MPRLLDVNVKENDKLKNLIFKGNLNYNCRCHYLNKQQ